MDYLYWHDGHEDYFCDNCYPYNSDEIISEWHQHKYDDVIFNKADKVGLATLPTNDNKLFISAKNRLNLNLLENEIKKALFSNWKQAKMFIPYENGAVLAYLKSSATIYDIKSLDEGTMLELELSPQDYSKYIDYVWVDDKMS